MSERQFIVNQYKKKRRKGKKRQKGMGRFCYTIVSVVDILPPQEEWSPPWLHQDLLALESDYDRELREQEYEEQNRIFDEEKAAGFPDTVPVAPPVEVPPVGPKITEGVTNKVIDVHYHAGMDGRNWLADYPKGTTINLIF